MFTMDVKQQCNNATLTAVTTQIVGTPHSVTSDAFRQDFEAVLTRGRTYVMITYVSKENNLGPDDKIWYIWGLKRLIFIL